MLRPQPLRPPMNPVINNSHYSRLTHAETHPPSKWMWLFTGIIVSLWGGIIIYIIIEYDTMTGNKKNIDAAQKKYKEIWKDGGKNRRSAGRKLNCEKYKGEKSIIKKDGSWNFGNIPNTLRYMFFVTLVLTIIYLIFWALIMTR